MIIFHKIRFKNILSYGNDFTEITLDSHPTTLIVGKNGSGKSSWEEALTFVLYGKTFRKINKPLLVNSINKKELLVEIEFTTSGSLYKIVRGMKPNIFEIYQNGKLLNQAASTRDYQEVLEKQILKMNYKTFCQVVILGSASFTPFMQLPAAQRREITEDVLDLQIFSVMNSILKDKISTNVSSLKDLEHQISMAEQKILLQKKHNSEMEKSTDEQIQEYKLKYEMCESEIQNCNKIIEDLMSKRERILSSIIKDPSFVENRLSKIMATRSQVKYKRDQKQQELTFYEEHDMCPTCHQNIEYGFKHNHIEELKNKLVEMDDGLSKLDVLFTETDLEHKKIKSVYNQCSDINLEVNIKKSSIISLTKEKKSIQDSILSLTEKKSKYKVKNKVQIDETELSNLINEKKNLIAERELYGISLSILKDNGIKSKIIKQYIPIMNKYINKYLSDMDFYVSFELDENFNEIIHSRHRDEFSYASFSEGEKMRLNLCILFAWRAIAKLRNSSSTNLLIMDETMDASLDSDGVDEFLKLVTSAEKSNIFIISHKTDAMLDKFERVIKVDKIKNFSEMEVL